MKKHRPKTAGVLPIRCPKKKGMCMGKKYLLFPCHHLLFHAAPIRQKEMNQNSAMNPRKKELFMGFSLRSNIIWGISLLLFVMFFTGCSKSSKYKAFIRSHDAIHPGMSIRQVFESGLADYLVQMKNKNVPGGTLPQKQPVSNTCERHVLDITYFASSFSGNFWIRVYCGMNEPSAPQVIPERSFKNKKDFLIALDSDYATWAKSMSFRVESPPKRLFGVYDNYEIITDAEGKVASVSPINVSK